MTADRCTIFYCLLLTNRCKNGIVIGALQLEAHLGSGRTTMAIRDNHRDNNGARCPHAKRVVGGVVGVYRNLTGGLIEGDPVGEIDP